MKTDSIDLDVLFKRTRKAIEKVNGSKMVDGKKADQKVQDLIVMQQGERSWHELVKKLKNTKVSFDHEPVLKFYESVTTMKEKFLDVDVLSPVYVEGFFAMSSVDKNRVSKVMETCQKIKDKENLQNPQNEMLMLVTNEMLLFIQANEDKIINSIKSNENFYDNLENELVEGFSNHHNIVNKEGMLSKIKKGFVNNNYGICFDYIYEMEVNDKTVKFTEVEKRVYGAAYVELIKDSLSKYSNIIENTEFTKVDFELLKNRLFKKLDKIFKDKK
jgi:extradiol dioxygenase family protein